MTDEDLMSRCLQLASLGLGKVSPNPMVGAVIVHNHRIIGEGWHQRYGEAHAEVNAIQEALNYLNQYFPAQKTDNSNNQFEQTTLYVNLEPCSHYGKTPPCADLIIFHKIKRVIIACPDPNPLVKGNGIEKLRQHGIEAKVGIHEKEATTLNRRFFTSQIKKRPYIILKWAESKNGNMAPIPHEPYWISGHLTQKLNHKWRTEEDAILIGKNTALIDTPELTARHWTGKNPKRFIIDWNLDLLFIKDSKKNEVLQTKLFNEKAITYLVNGQRSIGEQKSKGEQNQEKETLKSINFLQIENKVYIIQLLLYQMFLMDIGSIIVEGGKATLDQFIGLELWDEVRKIHSFNTHIEKGIPSPILPKSPQIHHKITLEDDEISYYYANFKKNPC